MAGFEAVCQKRGDDNNFKEYLLEFDVFVMLSAPTASLRENETTGIIV
jgi:hypothetical protein